MTRLSLLTLAGLALLAVGCTDQSVPTSGPTRPTPILVVPTEEAAAVATLSPPPALDPQDVRLSCGSPLAFSAQALRGPPGAELADHPAAAAFREQLLDGQLPHLPASGGWQIVVLTHTNALFLLPAPQENEEFQYWDAEFEKRDGSWANVGSGQCVVQPVFEDIEGARWELAPGERPTADSRRFDVVVTAQDCSSGQSPEGRIVPAAAIYQETSIIVIFGVRPLPGAQTCQGAPPATVTLELEEPLGDRRLLDGSVFPAEQRWP